VPVTVALERCADDARPFIERAAPTHPSLIDTAHVLAELYHVVNVPTILWIDESGTVVRPNDAQFGTDTFTAFHHKRSEPYLDMIRAWVREGAHALDPGTARAHQNAPTAEAQLARAERRLAAHLAGEGRREAAERHFQRAGELAPADWAIRRGSMPMRDMNPFGPEFFELAGEGTPTYPMDELTPTREEPEA
jgi:hypothetical protein